MVRQNGGKVLNGELDGVISACIALDQQEQLKAMAEYEQEIPPADARKDHGGGTRKTRDEQPPQSTLTRRGGGLRLLQNRQNDHRDERDQRGDSRASRHRFEHSPERRRLPRRARSRRLH